MGTEEENGWSSEDLLLFYLKKIQWKNYLGLNHIKSFKWHLEVVTYLLKNFLRDEREAKVSFTATSSTSQVTLYKETSGKIWSLKAEKREHGIVLWANVFANI